MPRVLASDTMSALQAAILGVIQGLTEFLPVSSSAHLYVIPTLLGWHYAGVAFDVALHWGTLLALIVALGGTWLALFRDALTGPPDRRSTAWSTLFKLAVAPSALALAFTGQSWRGGFLREGLEVGGSLLLTILTLFLTMKLLRVKELPALGALGGTIVDRFRR